MPRGRAHTLTLVCACSLAVAATVPAIGGAERQRGRHAARCKTAARARHRARRGRHCEASRHGATRTGTATRAPGAAAPSAGGGSGAPASGIAGVSPGGSSPNPGADGGIPSPGPPSLPHVQVIAVEYKFMLSRTSVPAGKVMFEFVNHGQDEHNLNISSAEGSFAGGFANTLASGVHDQELEVRHGSYTLFCSLPEHEQRGMKATLVVN